MVEVSRRPPFGSTALGVLVVIAASTLYSCASDGSPSVLDPHSPQARRIANLFWLEVGMAAVIYFVVVGLVIAALGRRARRDGREKSGKRLRLSRNDWFIVVGGVLVPLVTLSVVAVATVSATKTLSARDGTIQIRVEAERFWWRLTYPDENVVTANEIHVPVGKAVDLTITSDNVVHSVWVPQLNGKTDAIPGQVNHMNFTAETPGSYRGQCAEFCGIGHALMALVVIAEPEAEYEAWIRANQAAPAVASDSLTQQGRQLFVSGSCAGCHTVEGTEATGTMGPDLSHFALRSTIAAVQLPNDAEHLARWLAHTQQIKPGALMPQIDLSQAQIDALVAYLESLR
jgi:cytochrome c oxidase subunit 2